MGLFRRFGLGVWNIVHVAGGKFEFYNTHWHKFTPIRLYYRQGTAVTNGIAPLMYHVSI